MHPSWTNYDLLQYNNSAGNVISSLSIEPIFLSVFTGGKKPRNNKDSKFFEFEIWHRVTGFEKFFFIYYLIS